MVASSLTDRSRQINLKVNGKNVFNWFVYKKLTFFIWQVYAKTKNRVSFSNTNSNWTKVRCYNGKTQSFMHVNRSLYIHHMLAQKLLT